MNAYETLLADLDLEGRWALDENDSVDIYYKPTAGKQNLGFGPLRNEDSTSTSVRHVANTTEPFADWLAGHMSTVGGSNTDRLIHTLSGGVQRSDVGGNAAVSICFWYNTSYTGSGHNCLFAEGFSGTALDGIYVFVQSNVVRVRLMSNSVEFKQYPLQTLTADGNWHHMCITWDDAGDELLIYVDGSLASIDTGHGSYNDGSGSIDNDFIGLCLNARYDGSFSQSTDSFADLRYYSRVLSAQEADDIYTGHTPSQPTQDVYVDPTTKATVVRLLGDGFLDPMRHTPYGLQLEGEQGDVRLAVQWAIDNQRISNPEDRTIPGGPPGMFKPRCGANTTGKFWYYRDTLYIPDDRAGGCFYGFGSNNGQSSPYKADNPGAQTRFLYEPTTATKPAMCVQGLQWKLGNFGIVARKYVGNPIFGPDTGVTRPDFGIVFPYVGDSSDYFYDANRGNVQSWGASGCDIHDVHVSGFLVNWEVGRQKAWDGVKFNGNESEESAFLPPYGTWTKTWNNVDGPNGCDLHEFINCSATDGLIGIRFVNDQSQLCRLYNFGTGGNDEVGIDYFKGGPSRIDRVYVDYQRPPTIIRIGDLQTNTGQFIIDQIKVDSSAGTDFYLVEMDDEHCEFARSREGQIVVHNIQHSGYVSNPDVTQLGFKLVGNAVLTVNDSRPLIPVECVGETHINGSVWKPSVTYNNPRVMSSQAADPEAAVMSGDWSSFQMKNAVKQYFAGAGGTANERLPDVSSVNDSATLTLVASEGYQDASEVQALIDAGDFQSQAEVEALITGELEVRPQVIVSPTADLRGTIVTTIGKKEGQSRVLSYNVSAGYASVGKLYSDVTEVQVLIKKNKTTNTRYDKDVSSGKVSLPDANGIVTVTLEASDFDDIGTSKLTAGYRYYVIIKLTIAGVTGPVEVDEIFRLEFTEDQD